MALGLIDYSFSKTFRKMCARVLYAYVWVPVCGCDAVHCMLSSSMPVFSLSDNFIRPTCTTCSKGRTVAYYLQRELFELASNDDKDLLVAPENEDELTIIRYRE